jgi:integrase
MYKRLHKFCTVAGIPKFCPHSLRGLHSSLALASGATTHQVAASLGHASFSTTARHYADPAVIDNARAQRMVATLKSSSSVEQLVDSLSPAQREELMQLLTQKVAR